MSGTPPPLLEARAVVKRFGKLTALAGVDFSLRRGEVHALVGENGAGKSTLMSILYGVHAPDSGTVLVEGRAQRFSSCAEAMRAGIGMVFQHFLLVERFTAAENVLLGREPGAAGFFDAAAARALVGEIGRRYGFAVEPSAVVETLGVGARQQVELLKVLERDAAAIILDEPTASLSPAEAEALFTVIRRLRDEGRAVAFVSHKLREVLDIADRITVLRGGRVVGSLERGQATENELAALMIGRDLETADRERHAPMRRDIVLAASGLKAHRDDGAPALRSVTLEVCGGEIVGIAGVEGNGQLEFAECLYGLRPVSAGRITLRGSDITEASPPERRAMGMRYIPADRLREGLVLEFDAPENVLLGDQRRGTGMLLHLADARARAEAIAKEYALTRYRSEAPVAGYSGGMQQKLIVGRELSEDARAVIAYTPTRGVDVGAAETIARRLRAVRDAGAAVIVISYDLDEIRALSDRIIVFAGGRISGEADPNTATDAELGRLMGGLHDGA